MLLGVGAVASVVVVVLFWGRLRRLELPVAAAWVCLVVTCCLAPFIARRFVQDLRVTTRLHGYDRAAAGPVQAYLPGYLIDNARTVIPAGATFATVVSDAVPWAPARAAFPSLVMQTLFPRVSVKDPKRAEFLVTWGIPPARVVPVSRSWRVRARAGAYPAVFVGRVAR